MSIGPPMHACTHLCAASVLQGPQPCGRCTLPCHPTGYRVHSTGYRGQGPVADAHFPSRTVQQLAMVQGTWYRAPWQMRTSLLGLCSSLLSYRVHGTGPRGRCAPPFSDYAAACYLTGYMVQGPVADAHLPSRTVQQLAIWGTGYRVKGTGLVADAHLPSRTMQQLAICRMLRCDGRPPCFGFRSRRRR